MSSEITTTDETRITNDSEKTEGEVEKRETRGDNIIKKNPKVKSENEEQLGKELMVKEYTELADKEGILSLNIFEIKKNFKKSYEALVAFMESRVSNHMKLDEDTIVGTLMYAPRQVLYDFFDDNKLFINIHGSDNYWKYTFVANSNSDPYTSRASAEKHGFMEAFQILNSQ